MASKIEGQGSLFPDFRILTPKPKFIFIKSWVAEGFMKKRRSL